MPIEDQEYALAIDDVVDFDVKFTFKQKGIVRQFKFEMSATRLPQEEINLRLENKDEKVADLMRDLVTGWKNQRFVLNKETGEPAEFSPGALNAMLSAAGVSVVIFNAYFAECGAKAKN